MFVVHTNMGRRPFDMSKKAKGIVVTAAVMEMTRLVRSAASPAVPGERVAHAIARAARRLGFDRGRTESFWYGKVRSPSPEELETARAVAVKHAKDLELLRHEYRRAFDILARLETRLAVVDEDFHQPSISALRDMAGGAPGSGDASGLTPGASSDGGE
jgi:hypothetical protein